MKVCGKLVCARAALVLGCAAVVGCGQVGSNLSNVDAAVDVDNDGDGWTIGEGDCDDTNPNVHPGQVEFPYNYIDDNCDGYIDADFDGDRFTEEDGDCDDTDPSVYPFAPEGGAPGVHEPDGIDNDCDGIIDNHLPTYDDDGDGYTERQGDCNDHDRNMNPGAIDVPGNEIDEDCNGVADDEMIEPCDASGLAMDSTDPFDAAAAIGLCKRAYYDDGSEGFRATWGVLEARWILADGTDPSSTPNFHIGHGILSQFGPNVNVREGSRFLVLSSGAARTPTDPGYQDPSGYDKGYMSGTAWGYSPTSPNCPFPPTTGEPHDSIALELTIRVPTNARSATFDFNFFTWEYPVYICSTYNDYFAAMLDPMPPGQSDYNVSFDSGGNPISVNNALLQVCTPQTAGGINFTCPLGTDQLTGTGFEGHAATGWLQTTIAVDATSLGGEQVVKLLFGVWDSGDGVLDSSVVIDNWQWSADPANGSSTNPVD
ncbi:MAG: putative metal-binding motif-containing protein [bacterium]